jgi:acetylornithine deacetylase/succinyl-diaminopimelate desuccinylase-like protein
MVRVRSVAPSEEAMGRLVADEIRTLGLEPEWQQVAPGRPNVYCSVRLGPRPEMVTFTGHLDTVDVAQGWETDPFEPIERDGKLFGLGSVDMKSGLACAFQAFARLLRTREWHSSLGTIGFAATCDEEGFGTGARALLDTKYRRTNLMLLTEPFFGSGTDDAIPVVMPGKILYKVVVSGRSSHALMSPERGINAVEDASRIVAALDRLPLGSHPVLGRMNYSTLKIEGGYREYAVVVPEHCEVIITRLLAPGEGQASALRQLEELIGSLNLASAVAVVSAPPSYEPFELPVTDPGFVAFREAYLLRMGREPVTAGLLCITDGNVYLAEGGIPTVQFGPRGKGLHEKNEYVELETLDPVVDVLVETARRFRQNG